ncbi:MAG: putative transport system permease protein, partial [Gaiellaceae bacterium]|nr:putative transport system permease protein [Gaiellaceae bacterium]
MTALLRLGFVGLVRTPLRTAIRVASLAVAVALLGAMVLFIGHSLRTMTATATRSVPLDWQGPVGSYPAAVKVAGGVAKQPGVLQALPAATAPFAAAEHVSAAAGTIRSGAGSILAVPPDYPRSFSTLRFLRGTIRRGEVALDQQLAATLQAQPGDTVTLLPRPGAKPQPFRVSGIVLVTAPD